MPSAALRLRRVRSVTALVAVAALVPLLAPQAASAAGITIDGSARTHQGSTSSSITSGTLTTTQSGDLIVAFLASDGPGTGTQSYTGVTGGGLTWKLVRRVNAQPGTAEIWEAVAPSALTNVTVTATRATGSYVGSINVVAFAGADTTTAGATGGASALTGPPSVSLTTTAAGSWVWGVGDDWDNALSRTPGSGQTVYDQYLPSVGDTYWVQSQTGPGGAANAAVTLNDSAPTTDRYDFASVEIRPAVVDTTPPSTPMNLSAPTVTSGAVGLSWSPSTDNVAVAGYDIYRNGSLIGTSTSTAFTDATVAPNTTYQYAVAAYDAAGNVSPQSTAISVPTPPASTNPPVITGVTTSAITSTSATISWTTDIPSSSQVFFGTGPNYGQNTTLDPTLVTTHQQTLSGLAAGMTYHFEVQSTGQANNTGTSPDATFGTLAVNITLPDMQLKVPTSQISVGTNPANGHRQLQFTHITWDAGTGPFEIDPTYNASTGTATWTQAIYQSPSPGVWKFDHSVPVGATGVFDEPSDYQFPLTRFTLTTVNADGSPGTTVATSPKTDYCITGDTYVGGVPNTPNQTYIPQTNCTDPTKPLGWSVGWGDEYDQTDNGQPIDLTGVPDGTYILRGLVDPNHVLTESNSGNDETDTELQITGTSVAIISQTQPGQTPPTVMVTGPADGASVSGTVAVQASATPSPGATVTAVQFLLDGQPLGSPVTAAPYSYNWTVGNTALGSHTLSARVTDSNGNVATAQPITVTVVSGGGGGGGDTTPPTVSITNPTAGQTVSGAQTVAASASDNVAVASVQFYLDGVALGTPVTSAPYAINWDTTLASNGTHVLTAKATDTSGNVGTSSPVTVTVQNPGSPMTCFVMQADVSVHGTGKVTTPAFHTAMAGEALFAFVSSDGPNKSTSQTVTVSGAGLTWTLVKRSNGQPGDSEVWKATPTQILTNATVTSTQAKGGYAQDLTVVAMEDVSGTGAVVAASAPSGAPTTTLTTQGATSLVFAVGNDWDNAIPRTLLPGWALLDQWTNTSTGDDYWSQYTNTPTGAAGQVVTVGDSAPTTDRWNMVAVELLNDGT